MSPTPPTPPTPPPEQTVPTVTTITTVPGIHDLSATNPAQTAEAAGQREAAKLETAGIRDAGVLAAQRTSEAAVLRVEGQRNINLIWETTQQKIALFVIGASLLVSCVLGVFGKWLGSPELQLASIVSIYGAANLVIGFYFGRTNHTKVGGVSVEGER